METPQTDYDAFAYFYNKYWGENFASRIFPILDALVLSRLPASSTILDLCCGTGQLAKMLIEQGYSVTGIDSSQAMLRFAQKNAPNARFVLSDARTFNVPGIYSLVISTYDSLNHIMTIDDIIKVFKNVHAVLTSGSFFIFDLNMDQGYKMKWKGSFGLVDETDACIVKSRYSIDTKIATMDITLFQSLDEYWKRSDIILYQKCYDDIQIKDALQESGFSSVKIYDAEIDLNLRGNVGRYIFFAFKD